MIEVKNLTKKYDKTIAVDNISFEINDGEIVGFLGPNGAGKTTTMNMLTGFIEPTSGKVLINGYDIDTKPKMAKKQFGYMPENVPSAHAQRGRLSLAEGEGVRNAAKVVVVPVDDDPAAGAHMG